MAWEQGENPDDLALSRTRPDAAVARQPWTDHSRSSRSRRQTCVCASGGATLKSRTGQWQWTALLCRHRAAKRPGDVGKKTLTTRRPAGGRFQDFVAGRGTNVSPTGFTHCRQGPFNQIGTPRAPVPAGLVSPQWLIRPGVRRGSPLHPVAPLDVGSWAAPPPPPRMRPTTGRDGSNLVPKQQLSPDGKRQWGGGQGGRQSSRCVPPFFDSWTRSFAACCFLPFFSTDRAESFFPTGLGRCLPRDPLPSREKQLGVS